MQLKYEIIMKKKSINISKLLFLVMYFISFLIYGQHKNIYTVPKDKYKLEELNVTLSKKKYKILVLELLSKKNQDNAQHNSNSIVILQKQKNDYYEVFRNDDIIFSYNDNCPADGFQGIDVKNNFFTIKQTFCSDFNYVYSFTTFKIDKISGKIFLHKYGDQYTDRSNPQRKISPVIWTTLDFGILKFEEVTQSKINLIRQNPPKHRIK